jgi:hypothetical protein
VLSHAERHGEERSQFELSEVLNAGFANVRWEDRGAQGSEFDDFDTLEHFRQVQIVQDLFARVLPNKNRDAEELVLMLQELRPELFSIVGDIGHAILCSRRGRGIEDFYQHTACYFASSSRLCPLTSVARHPRR